MPTIWYCLVAIMIAVYVILDGFDLGAGIIHLFAAKNDAERRAVLASIGPVWDGNEVWLLAAGGILYFAFPSLYASGFSGFYLALMIVLWLLILRGISVEFRNHLPNELWRTFWDVVFSGASMLLALFYGAALGNVVRGVPLDGDGYFFLPLWTNLQPGANPGIIDWYTVLVGATACAALTLHGALWVALKTEGDLQARANKTAKQAWLLLLPAVVSTTVASFWVQPLLRASYSERPWGLSFSVVAAVLLLSIPRLLTRRAELPAFLASAGFLLTLLCSAAFGLYPDVLPSNVNPSGSLTVANASAAAYGLRVGFFWFVPAFILAGGYSWLVYRHFAGKVQVERLHS